MPRARAGPTVLGLLLSRPGRVLGDPGPPWLEEAPGQGQAAGLASAKAENPTLEPRVAAGDVLWLAP